MTPGTSVTFGGLEIDTDAHVLDTNNQPIKGLYVAGQDAGGYFSYPYYEGAGWTQGFAWTSGMIAVQHMVENAK